MTSYNEDLKLFFDTYGKEEWADIKKENGDFVRENGLETAVLLSLKLNARVDEKKSYKNNGFWAESLIGYNIGSKLWLLNRNKITKDTLRLYEQYSKEALKWMIDEGISEKIEVAALKSKRYNGINVYIAIYRPTGEIEKFKYIEKWSSQIGG